MSHNDDQTDIEWRHPLFLQHEGLNPDNVLQYISVSPFYDPTCNNNVLRMQSQHNGLPLSNLREIDMALRGMTGTEYQLTFHRHPSLYIIQKQHRRNENEVTPLSNYYILNGNMYQSPDLFQLLTSRITQALYHLDKSFQMISRHVKFTPGIGYSLTTPSELATPLATASSTGVTATSKAGKRFLKETQPVCVPHDEDLAATIHASEGFRINVDHLIAATATKKNFDVSVLRAPVEEEANDEDKDTFPDSGDSHKDAKSPATSREPSLLSSVSKVSKMSKGSALGKRKSRATDGDDVKRRKKDKDSSTGSKKKKKRTKLLNV